MNGGNWLGVMFGAMIYMARHLNTKKIGVEIFGDLRNVVLEENGEDNMVGESN
jgi:hypothetical protein